MTISSIDPATPNDDEPVGDGDNEFRALKAALVAQFAGQAGDLWDTPLTAGPRALNGIGDKADEADLTSLEARVSVNELAIITQAATFTSQDARLTALEADSHTLNEALEAAWPVGSLFISADGGTPASKGLPGTWGVVGNSRFLLGGPSGEAGDTGGSNETTLVEANIPQHKHGHTSFVEGAATTGTIPATYRQSPTRLASGHLAGTQSSKTNYIVFNTDEGVNLSSPPDPVDTTPAYLKVTFYERTA